MRFFLSSLCLLLTALLSAQTTIVGSIHSGGLVRDYRLYVPASYSANGTPVPLILNFHGYTSNYLEQEFYGNFRNIADTANFLVVHPNGTLDGQGQRFWNTFGNPAAADDVAFVANLLDTLEATYNIDAQRIYSTGMSNGGFMSYKLACELNDRIAAIASVTGSMIQSELNACNVQRPVPVMEIHGTADATVPYNGLAVLTFVPIPDLVSAWVGFNHCNPTPTFTTVPNNNTSDGCTAEHYLYTGGDKGSTVEHFKVLGGAHTWPGAAFTIDVTNQDFNASQEIWRFFRQYRLDQLSEVATPNAAPDEWSVFPNPTNCRVTLQSAHQGMAKRVQIFDATGRLQQTLLPPDANPIVIQTAAWPQGLYFLVIESDTAPERLHLVKQ